MEAKKYPALIATLVVLALVSIAGIALSAVEISKFSANQKALASKDAELRRLLTAERVALTPENVDAAKESLAKFSSAEAAYRADLAGAAAARFDAEFKGDPGELGSEIKEFVERWQSKLKADGVKIVAAKPEEFAFGFSRYYQTGVNPQKSLSAVYRQTKVVDFLLKTLQDSKLKEEVRLLGVSRQPVELVGVSSGNFNKDEVSGETDSVLHRDGLLRSETFRIRFTARTDVVRRFVNAVTDARRPVCVRGLEIAPATKEQLQDPKPAGAADLALPANLFGDATAPAGDAPKADAVAKPEVVVAATPVDVTVTFAYIEAVKPEAAAPAASNP